MALAPGHQRHSGCSSYMGHIWETVPVTGEAARFPAETLGTHKDGNTEYNVTSTGSPTATPGNESLIKQPHCTMGHIWGCEGVPQEAEFACMLA
jgi:hypothetical protein